MEILRMNNLLKIQKIQSLHNIQHPTESLTLGKLVTLTDSELDEMKKELSRGMSK